MRWVYLAAAFAVVAGIGSAFAQPEPPLPLPKSGFEVGRQPSKTGFELPGVSNPARREVVDPKPKYNYELKPEHGEFFVFVKSFQAKVAGDETGKARELAEGLAEYIRSECRLYAFVHERGWLQRQERKKEKDAMEAKAREYYSSQGFTQPQIEEQLRRLTKMARIPDEYSVFVAPGKGTLKNIDEALEFAKFVRKLKAPPAEYCDSVVLGSVDDLARKRGEPNNPFPLAMPGRNPTLPRKDVALERPKADEFLMNINAGKPHSLIHNTKKPFTLVVKTYGAGLGQVTRAGGTGSTNTKSDGELLERAAQQAHLMADILRNMEPAYDAYVLHTRFESFVCVGEYDSKDDPKLLEVANALKGLKVRDDKVNKGEVLETFMEKPMPAMIPRP